MQSKRRKYFCEILNQYTFTHVYVYTVTMCMYMSLIIVYLSFLIHVLSLLPRYSVYVVSKKTLFVNCELLSHKAKSRLFVELRTVIFTLIIRVIFATV